MEGCLPIPVLLADELAMVREGLATVVEATGRYQIVAQCGDGAAVIEEVRRILLLHISAPAQSP